MSGKIYAYAGDFISLPAASVTLVLQQDRDLAGNTQPNLSPYPGSCKTGGLCLEDPLLPHRPHLQVGSAQSRKGPWACSWERRESPPSPTPTSTGSACCAHQQGGYREGHRPSPRLLQAITAKVVSLCYLWILVCVCVFLGNPVFNKILHALVPPPVFQS